MIILGAGSGERSRRRLEQHASRTLIALEGHQETVEESDVCSEGVEQKNEIWTKVFKAERSHQVTPRQSLLTKYQLLPVPSAESSADAFVGIFSILRGTAFMVIIGVMRFVTATTATLSP